MWTPCRFWKEVGGAFAGTGMTEEGTRKTREHMLAEKIKNAQRFPNIGLSAQNVYGELPKLGLDMALTLHGIQRRQLIPTTVRVEGGALTATGSFVIRQTDYGITPSSAMGGGALRAGPHPDRVQNRGPNAIKYRFRSIKRRRRRTRFI
jgi:hypothetical protein